MLCGMALGDVTHFSIHCTVQCSAGQCLGLMPCNSLHNSVVQYSATPKDKSMNIAEVH